jgi:hypothetical protein
VKTPEAIMSVGSSSTTEARAQRGEEIYRQLLRQKLEPAHEGEFVAIEPDSGDHFLGQTSHQAILNARQKYPDKIFHVIRIGHPVVGTIGRRWHDSRIRQTQAFRGHRLEIDYTKRTVVIDLSP